MIINMTNINRYTLFIGKSNFILVFVVCSDGICYSRIQQDMQVKIIILPGKVKLLVSQIKDNFITHIFICFKHIFNHIDIKICQQDYTGLYNYALFKYCFMLQYVKKFHNTFGLFLDKPVLMSYEETWLCPLCSSNLHV